MFRRCPARIEHAHVAPTMYTCYVHIYHSFAADSIATPIHAAVLTHCGLFPADGGPS